MAKDQAFFGINLPGPTLRSAGSSASCSATSLAPQHCLLGWTQKT
jgi:hypothetical protein